MAPRWPSRQARAEEGTGDARARGGLGASLRSLRSKGPDVDVELKADLDATCPLASAYHDWLIVNRQHLRIPATSFKRSRQEKTNPYWSG